MVKNDYRSFILKTNVRARDFVGKSSEAMRAIRNNISEAFTEKVEVQGDGKFNYCLNNS